MAYLLEHGIVLPRRLQMEFRGLVQIIADEAGQEIISEMIQLGPLPIIDLAEVPG